MFGTAGMQTSRHLSSICIVTLVRVVAKNERLFTLANASGLVQMWLLCARGSRQEIRKKYLSEVLVLGGEAEMCFMRYMLSS